MSHSITPRAITNILPSFTRHIATGCGIMRITLCWDNRRDSAGIKDVMISLGKSGGCACAQTHALSMVLSAALQLGADPAELASMLIGISCGHPGNHLGEPVISCGDAIGKLLTEFVAHTPKGVSQGT